MHHWITVWNVGFLQVTSSMIRNLIPLRWGSNLHIFHSSYLIMMSNKMGSHADHKCINGWPSLKKKKKNMLFHSDLYIWAITAICTAFCWTRNSFSKKHFCHVDACVVVRVFMTICHDTPSHEMPDIWQSLKWNFG